MKKLIALVLALACVLCLSACDGKAGKDFDKADDLHQFSATILEIHDGYFLVEPSAGMDELKSADKIEVSTKNTDKSIDWKVGDLVLITYDGVILESYPARLNQVYMVEKGTLKLTENETQSGGTPADEAFDITVSYANWCELSEIYTKALNTEKMNVSCVRHLPIYRFDTLAELEQFKNDFKDVLSFDTGYDEIPSFNEATAKYDENFFAENTLMLVYIEAGSGSYRYGVDSVYHADGNFCIHVKQINNTEVVTYDMAGWFITVAVTDNMIANCTEFDADLSYIETGSTTGFENEGLYVSIADFSYSNDKATYVEGQPGVKTSGFVNTTKVDVDFHNVADIAKNECTINYSSVRTYLDTAECIWKVVFYTEGTVGNDQTVYLDYEGKTVLIVYGE